MLWLALLTVRTKQEKDEREARMLVYSSQLWTPEIQKYDTASGKDSCCLDLLGELRGHHGNTARQVAGWRGSLLISDPLP